ncbi:MAG: HAD family hydrolase [Caldimicrobium sp.]|jgi:HAD superfamily hydrolase (TIGR01509 family)|uniref:HAD family phosphatase n=1 Tax=Caldimicrobium thiodismutans TaxID=1653476 RepID=A0A2N7PIZ8_9BACT|nr:MAG: HAD family phosphatase [Caldimicrobium thiodismutans]
MKEFIFFDLDGVLLDSMPYHAKAWILAFKEFGLDFTEEEIFLHEGAIELDSAKSLFLNKGVNPTQEFFEKVFKLQKKIFKEKFSKEVKPYPEVPDLLFALKKEKKKLALVTSSSSEILKEVFPEKLHSFFEVIITGDQVEKRKPHPDPYLKAKEALKAPKEEITVVENAPAGILAAKRAELFCIGITTTLQPKHLSLADLIVKNHQELKNLLLNGKR